jgi:hypothetical protein
MNSKADENESRMNVQKKGYQQQCSLSLRSMPMSLPRCSHTQTKSRSRRRDSPRSAFRRAGGENTLRLYGGIGTW